MTWEPFSGDALYLDSNIIIYAIEIGNPWFARLHDLFEAIDEGAIRAFTSELTIAEVLTKPIALKEVELIAKYDRLLSVDSMIAVVPVDRSILRTAAELRARRRLRLVDAIHAATAKHCSCDFFFTHDDKLGGRLDGELEWLPLTSLEAEE